MKNIIFLAITLIAFTGCDRTCPTSYTPRGTEVTATTNCQMGGDIYRILADNGTVAINLGTPCAIEFEATNAHSYNLTFTYDDGEVQENQGKLGLSHTEDGTPLGLLRYPVKLTGTLLLVVKDAAGYGIGRMELLVKELDTDSDKVPDTRDNCVYTPNPGQEDLDDDGYGDACDYDWDGDKWLNWNDNCPRTYNPGQEDNDLDGLGDACDDDDDNDTVPDREDNCPLTWNPRQEDSDNDGVGDACDDDDDRCGVCEGKVSWLTLRYQSSCGRVQAYQMVQGTWVKVYDRWLKPGSVFTVKGADNKGTLGPKVRLYVNRTYNAEIHTSCSQPVGPGLVAGDFKVLAGESREGGSLCPLK